MPLTPTAAATAADAYCTDQGITDTAAKSKWEAFYKKIYASLLIDLTATVAASSIVTVGGPATQTGPAAPVPTVIA